MAASTLADHPGVFLATREWRRHPAASIHRSISLRQLRIASRLVSIRPRAVDKDLVAKEDDLELPLESVDRRREKEQFIVRDLGKFQCRSCGNIYDQSVGDPSYPVPPGVEFGQLPEDWRCSTCGAAKSYFNSISVEVAGFAENQSYGFGTNTLTSGQKSLLIYGSLLLFFILFLSGYFLQ